MRVIRYVNCPEVEQEHRQNERQYAHTFHYEGVVCLCDAFWRLPRPYRDGILLHEIGHLLVGPEGSEQEATEAAEQVFGVDIVYVDSDYGEALERVVNPGIEHTIAQLEGMGWTVTRIGSKGRGRIKATRSDLPDTRIEIDYKHGFDAHKAWRYISGGRTIATNYDRADLIEWLRG